jgi:bifunctional non-homologous end joining protein LigD
VRPRDGAPVAMPLRWEELADARLRPDGWTIATAPDRVRAEGDAWKGMSKRARGIQA